ncbi:MAG TPA: hypothetical protein VGL93_10375 [Streptosporangiaceae bacterium]|jgi:hypothetical protein
MTTTTRRPFKPCGTTAAYDRHRRHGETPCDACRTAYVTNRRERRQAARTAPPAGIEAEHEIDEIAVERAAHGDTTVPLNHAERVAAARQILAWGHTRTEIARRLRVSGTAARTLQALATGAST